MIGHINRSRVAQHLNLIPKEAMSHLLHRFLSYIFVAFSACLSDASLTPLFDFGSPNERALDSEIRYPSIVAPIALVAPPQRLILGPADLAGLGVDVALELRWRAAEQAGVDVGDLRGGRGSGCTRRCGVGFGLEGGRHGGGALQALELGLLAGGELRRRGARAEAGREADGGEGAGAEERAEVGCEEARHCCWCWRGGK